MHCIAFFTFSKKDKQRHRRCQTAGQGLPSPGHASGKRSGQFQAAAEDAHQPRRRTCSMLVVSVMRSAPRLPPWLSTCPFTSTRTPCRRFNSDGGVLRSCTCRRLGVHQMQRRHGLERLPVHLHPHALHKAPAANTCVRSPQGLGSRPVFLQQGQGKTGKPLDARSMQAWLTDEALAVVHVAAAHHEVQTGRGSGRQPFKVRAAEPQWWNRDAPGCLDTAARGAG